MHQAVDRSVCGTPLREATITDVDFADNFVIFAELVDGLVRALEVLREAEPLGLRISWLKTKLQSFDDSTIEAIEPVCIAGEDVVQQRVSATLAAMPFHLVDPSQPGASHGRYGVA